MRFSYIVLANHRVGRRGGGTLILVKPDLLPHSIKLKFDNQDHYNITVINLGAASCSTVVCCVYRPPDTSSSLSESLVKQLEIINASTDVRILVGDSNYPHINWNSPALTSHDGQSDLFQHACNEMGLSQCVSGNTHGSNV
jgi:hypothetical protein